MAINDTYMLSVIGVAAGQQHIHTLHFRNLTAVDPRNELIANWRASCEATYRGCFVTFDAPNQLHRVDHVCGGPLESAVETAVPVGAANNGTRTAASNRAPPFMASLVKERTNLAGRSRQGRFFLGGLLESDFELSDMTGPYIAALQAYIDALKAAFVTPSIPELALVVHSRTLASEPGTDCQDSSERVTDLIASPRPTTMRSRKLGHGN